MQSSLSWIEWLDRFDRILTSTRQDLAALARVSNARSLAAVECSRRLLAALVHDLRLLDPSVLSGAADHRGDDAAGALHRALEAALHYLGKLGAWQAEGSRAERERILAAVDAALRDCFCEAAALLSPQRRRA